MANRLLKNFYDLQVRQLMDKRLWDLPICEKKEEISTVLNILGGRNHVWVINTRKKRELVGVITEHDILSTLTPTRFSPYMFGVPDVRSLQYGTVQTAEDIMCKRVITCKEDEKVIDVLRRMTKYRLRRLPVVKNKQLVGEITLNLLIRKYFDATQYHAIVEEG